MSIPAARRAQALRLVHQGHSINDAAKRTGISRKTITRWLDATPLPETPQPAESPLSAEALASSASELTREIAGQSLELARLAKQDGNSTAASRALKTARDSANDLRREEVAKNKDRDGIFFSKEQLESAMRTNYDRVAKLAADLERTGGLCCAKCGAEVRLRLAQGGS